MRTFVISDVHGNIRALDAVLGVYRDISPCELLFLGDAVGYGAHPDACLDRLSALPRSTLIMGNHEWALFDPEEKMNFNELAAQAVDWSKTRLRDQHEAWILREFRIIVRRSEYCAAHASPEESSPWEYIYTESAAARIFRALDFSICFLGHTHVPMVYTYKGGPKSLEPGKPFPLDPSDRYIVNPGSVGQPRDRDHRASCLVWDGDASEITLHRVEYDVEAEAKDIEDAGLPHFFAERLKIGA